MAKKKSEKDVLIVRDEKTGEISVVAGLDADGSPKRTPAKAENAQSFLQFDRHGDVLDNFFKNFFRQCKEPSRFGFYRFAADQADKLMEVMKDLLKDPEANKELLAPHKVDTSGYEKQVKEEQTAGMPEQKQEGQPKETQKQEDGSVKSSVDKFYTQEVLLRLKETMKAVPGDLILIMSGEDAMKTRKQLCELRLEMGTRLGLRDKNKFSLLWVVDFPMFEWSEEEGRLMAMHHPFTHPKDEDIPLLDSNPAAVRADAYDMVCNGVEVGGGSIRIHDPELQDKMFKILGFTGERAQEQFGFLMDAFKYGAPPHGGLAYGLDRWVSLFAGLDSIRDCIAFPKNNSGRDVMLDAPSYIDQKQLDELNLALDLKD